MRKRAFFLVILSAVLLITGLASISFGATQIDPVSLLKAILNGAGFRIFGEPDETLIKIIFLIRLPRIVAAMLVGGSLAMAGAVMQGLFRNPLASPEILGVSAGGSLGAVIAISTGLFAVNIVFMPLFSIAGAFVGIAFIYSISYSRGSTSLFIVVLSGMAISSFFTGIVSAILMVVKEFEMSQFIFWIMGGLDSRSWEHVMILLPVFLAVASLLIILGRPLNLFALGEEGAHSLGVRVELTKRVLLAASALVTGVAVSISGSIGFVGLLVPHALRLLIGPDSRLLIPASALGGGIFLVVCDAIGRSIVSPYEVKVGVITALLGAPYLIALLIRFKRRMKGGFASDPENFA